MDGQVRGWVSIWACALRLARCARGLRVEEHVHDLLDVSAQLLLQEAEDGQGDADEDLVRPLEDEHVPEPEQLLARQALAEETLQPPNVEELWSHALTHEVAEELRLLRRQRNLEAPPLQHQPRQGRMRELPQPLRVQRAAEQPSQHVRGKDTHAQRVCHPPHGVRGHLQARGGAREAVGEQHEAARVRAHRGRQDLPAGGSQGAGRRGARGARGGAQGEKPSHPGGLAARAAGLRQGPAPEARPLRGRRAAAPAQHPLPEAVLRAAPARRVAAPPGAVQQAPPLPADRPGRFRGPFRHYSRGLHGGVPQRSVRTGWGNPFFRGHRSDYRKTCGEFQGSLSSRFALHPLLRIQCLRTPSPKPHPGTLESGKARILKTLSGRPSADKRGQVPAEEHHAVEELWLFGEEAHACVASRDGNDARQSFARRQRSAMLLYHTFRSSRHASTILHLGSRHISA